MKTRKVGRVLSLLLAIAMVVGLMIPASSVLAETTYDVTITAQADGSQWMDLRDALNNANYGNDPDNPTKILLEADVEVPYKYFKWSYSPDFTGYGVSVKGTKNNKDCIAETGRVSYNDYRLIVPEGKNFEIELNGHSISLSKEWQNRDSSQEWTGNPQWTTDGSDTNGALSSVIYMSADSSLTINDRVGTGMIFGGTGSFHTRNSDGTVQQTLYSDHLTGSLPINKPGGGLYLTPVGGADYTIYRKAKYNYSLGGGVFVGEGAHLTLNGGNITRNVAYSANADNMFNADNNLYSLGGGVYVAKGGVFTMNGGSVSNNNARCYHKSNSKMSATAQGAGVYLDTNATMYFSGGEIDENCTYAEIYKGDKQRGAFSEGGGIYVAANASLNVRGKGDVRADWPSISGNACGGYLRETSIPSYLHVQGAGIFVAGTANISDAVITANIFPSIFSGDPSTGNTTSNVIKRDEDNQVVYESGTENPVMETKGTDSGIYGVAADSVSYSNVLAGNSSTNYIYANGAGVCLTNSLDDNGDFTAVLNIGGRVWCYDNWDTKTNGFNNPTHDDVYLALGANDTSRTQYVGCAAPATESKIGINDQGNLAYRIVVRKANANTINPGFWGEFQGYTPTQTDVQFFWDNGDNQPAADTTAEAAVTPTRVVVFDTQTDTTEDDDVLRFGDKSEGQATDDNGATYYLGYIMLNFDEAKVHKYSATEYETSNRIWQDSRPTEKTKFYNNNALFTVTLPQPDYSYYGPALSTNTTPNKDNATATLTNRTYTTDENGAPAYDTANDNRADLYFKGYHFYAPYGENDTTGANDVDIKLNVTNTHSFTGAQLLSWNDNPLHQSVPAYTATWYTAEELAEARNRISDARAQAVVLEDGTKVIRLLALVDNCNYNIADYEAVGFVWSTTNATPTIEGGYRYSVKDMIYRNIWVNLGESKQFWLDSYYMMQNSTYSSDVPTVNWSNFKKDVSNKKAVGLVYTNLAVSDIGEDAIIYVTPYIKASDGTYYYGDSRAVRYNSLIAADASAASN